MSSFVHLLAAGRDIPQTTLSFRAWQFNFWSKDKRWSTYKVVGCMFDIILLYVSILRNCIWKCFPIWFIVLILWMCHILSWLLCPKSVLNPPPLLCFIIPRSRWFFPLQQCDYRVLIISLQHFMLISTSIYSTVKKHFALSCFFSHLNNSDQRNFNFPQRCA